MEICVAVAVTLWVAALVASPRRPLMGNEVQELVYVRLLGRQQLLVFVATAATAALALALVLSLPARVHADLARGRTRCETLTSTRKPCYVYENGRWEIALSTPAPSATGIAGPRLDHGVCDPVEQLVPTC